LRGAQWSKLNDLSGGAVPAAFKGFENTPGGLPACGTAWSTGPGNSPPPPSGPLPAFMAVIVSSSVSKSGSTISGDTVHVVIVQTNAGYAPESRARRNRDGGCERLLIRARMRCEAPLPGGAPHYFWQPCSSVVRADARTGSRLDFGEPSA
jgi:hypothetical protein